jgi:hypothetical protein
MLAVSTVTADALHPAGGLLAGADQGAPGLKQGMCVQGKERCERNREDFAILVIFALDNILNQWYLHIVFLR